MTRKCPNCNKVYNDESLNFCLDDGGALVPFVEINNENSDPTVIIPQDTISTVSTPSNAGGGNFFFYTTIVLSVVLLSGIFGSILYFALAPDSTSTDLVNANLAKADASTKNSKSIEDDKKSDDKEEKKSLPPAIGENPNQSEPEYTPPPKPKKSTSKSFGNKEYRGDIGGQPVTVNLDFKRGSKDVVGSYYFSNSPGDVYLISGTNYAQGRAKLTVSDGMNKIATINLYKTLEGKNLCWQGTIAGNAGEKTNMRFCRRR